MDAPDREGRVSRPAADSGVRDGLRRQDGPGGNVLVIDDDPAVRALTARVVRTPGLQWVDRGDVDAAFTFLAAHPDRVHTVLTDGMMPGPETVQVCERLRAVLPAVRILVMSGAESIEEQVQGIADSFIAKPFSVADLRRALGDAPAGLAA